MRYHTRGNYESTRIPTVRSGVDRGDEIPKRLLCLISWSITLYKVQKNIPGLATDGNGMGLW